MFTGPGRYYVCTSCLTECGSTQYTAAAAKYLSAKSLHALFCESMHCILSSIGFYSYPRTSSEMCDHNNHHIVRALCVYHSHNLSSSEILEESWRRIYKGRRNGRSGAVNNNTSNAERGFNSTAVAAAAAVVLQRDGGDIPGTLQQWRMNPQATAAQHTRCARSTVRVHITHLYIAYGCWFRTTQLFSFLLHLSHM